MAKANKMQMKEREVRILELLAQGYTRSKIAVIVSQQFDCTELAVEKQHDKVLKKWVDENKDQLDSARAEYMIKLGEIYQRAWETGQFKLASDIIEKQAKLMGLYNPKAESQKEVPKINIVERDAPLSVVPNKKAENDE